MNRSKVVFRVVAGDPTYKSLREERTIARAAFLRIHMFSNFPFYWEETCQSLFFYYFSGGAAQPIKNNDGSDEYFIVFSIFALKKENYNIAK